MPDAVLNAGTTVGFDIDTPDTFVTVPGIISFGAIGETGEAKDMTTLEDTVKRYGKGIFDTPEISIKGQFYSGDAEQEKLVDAARQQQVVQMEVTWTDGTVAKLTVQLLGFQMDEGSGEEWMMFTIAGKQSGATAWTKPTPPV